MSQQILLDDDELPAPGEPLKPKIDDHNQQLLDADIAERARRAQADLTWWQRLKLKWRYQKLRKHLNQHHYNDLIMERYRLHQTCVRLDHEMQSASPARRKKMAAEMAEAVRDGKAINEIIHPLKPYADEFIAIEQRMSAYRELKAWEKEDTENRAEFKREARTWEQIIKAVFRQTPRLHHISINKRGKTVCRIPQFERIAFKDDRVLYQIRITRQNLLQRFIGRYSSALPYGVDIPELTSDVTLQNLTAACRRTVTVERSKIGASLYYAISRMDAADGIPKKQLYTKCMDWYPAQDHPKTPWIAGATAERKVEFYNFEDQPHVLIGGSTKSGKSNHVNQMIATLVTMNAPSEVRLLLLDMKGGIEFTHWAGIKHSLGPMIKKQDHVLPALQNLRSIMERRLAIFEEIRAKNLSSYNEKSQYKLARIICVIDEMATLIGLGELTSEIHNELRVLTSQGRAVGVHMVLCTQHPSVDVLPGWCKTNMTLRVCGKMTSHQASMIVLDTVTAATIEAIAGRMVFSIGREEKIAQSPFISDEMIAIAVAESKKHPEPDNSEFSRAQPVVVKEKFSAFDALEIAINQLNYKLSPTRIFDAAPKDVTTERKVRHIVEDIIEQKEVEHRGIRYRIRKERKYHMLDVIGQPVNEESTEDTEEVTPTEYPIDDRQTIEEPIS